MTEIRTKGQLAKRASYSMNTLTTAQKNEALAAIAAQLRQNRAQIVEANKIDLQNGADAGLPSSTLDRILLNDARIDAMADAILLLIDLPDPVGEVLEDFTKDNGLHMQKIRVPLGVAAMIYEARPNVTVDAATLCLKTGNAVVLRGSSSAKHSNIALVQAIHEALATTDCPVDAVQLIEDTSREAAAELFHLKEYIDVLIPRGGAALINLVVREASVPVLETGAGNCHVFIDASAPLDMTTSIVLNAKTQRPSVCNAAESLLIEKSWLATHGQTLLATLHDAGVHIIGDEAVQAIFPNAQAATDADWATEYLDYTISVKTVEDVVEAITHINTYGTHHSEAIITFDEANAQQFLRNVDAAAVYHNASTRFTDGFEFGYGAEIGISTQKLHARGPMGLPALTSTKYIGIGTGQIR